MLSSKSFFTLAAFAHHDLFSADEYAWQALKNLKQYLDSQSYDGPEKVLGGKSAPLLKTRVLFNNELLDADELTIAYGDTTKAGLKVYRQGRELTGASVIMAGAVLSGEKIRLGRGVLVEPGALIKSPTMIGDHTEIRQGAYVRGYCLVGERCVVGHVTEIKHSIMLNDAKAGHFAYLGDSIAGNHVNLGAGTKLANLRFTNGDINVRTAAGSINTGLRKMGAILGDQVQTGCNSVTNPGCLLGRKSLVMPNTTVPSGYHADSSLIR